MRYSICLKLKQSYAETTGLSDQLFMRNYRFQEEEGASHRPEGSAHQWQTVGISKKKKKRIKRYI